MNSNLFSHNKNIFSSVTSLSNRKNHGSVSSSDSGHSEALSYCEGNVYHLTSSIIHNAPVAAPLPPRRHSAVQGSNTSNYFHQQLVQPNTGSSLSAKQANGDIISMPPPPNPRTRSAPFCVVTGSNPAAYNLYTPQQQSHFNQLRHTGKKKHLSLKSK